MPMAQEDSQTETNVQRAEKGQSPCPFLPITSRKAIFLFLEVLVKHDVLKNHRLTITFKDGKVERWLSRKTPAKQVRPQIGPCQIDTEAAR